MTLRIPIPKALKIEIHEKTRAEVLIDGLYPGYGVTVGNALRRVLLSSLPGAAITSFRIAGVSHEFTTVPGVTEDIVEVSLNLKRVRLKSFSEEPVELTLKVKGEREVVAADIESNPMVEIANPETRIATLTDKSAALEMTFRVEQGIGYLPVELRKKEKLSIGEIALDAIFTPVTKVNFQVENMRVGERTDYNRLRLAVATDGTLDPVVAIKEASSILTDHLSVFGDLASLGDSGSDKDKKTVKKISRRKITK